MQASEVVDLGVALAVAPLLIAVWSRTAVLRGSAWWLTAYGFVVVAYVATIVEGVGGVAGDLLNLFEHGSLLAAGVSFALFASRLLTETKADRS